VAAAAHGDRRVVSARERDAPGDVVGTRAAHDRCRAAIDHAVVDCARLVVSRVAGSDDAVVEIGEVATGDVGQRGRGGHVRCSPV
jgi:hypothetical protein